jgi:hypothetical protein
MKNIAENNIKIALALGFQKTPLGWYDANEVLAGVETDGNTFDELLFHENRDWVVLAIEFLRPSVMDAELCDDLDEMDEWEDNDILFDVGIAYDLLLRIMEDYRAEEFIEDDEDEEEKMTSVVVEELTQKHIDCVLRLCEDDGDIIQHLGKAKKMVDEVLRETLINAIRHIAKNGVKMEIQLESGDTGKIVVNGKNEVLVNDDGFSISSYPLDDCHTIELQNFYNDGKKRLK